MGTRRLYWDDSLLLSFEARVVAHASHAGRPALVLDASAFYPEAGGQLADRGRATWDGGLAAVVDAQEDDDGRVLHLLDGAPATLPEVGQPVRIEVDERRRRDHMSQHTGQHMLSRALFDRAGAATASSRLGEASCTIDTPLSRIADEALADAEALVNDVILEDRPVRALMPTKEELARLPLRREPKVTTDVRVIDVDGFDLSPCGGTHVVRTGQVGAVRVTGVERHRGGLRFTFRTGRRALADAAEKERVLATLARELTCGHAELPGAIEKLRAEARESSREVEKLRAGLASALATKLVESAPPSGSPPVRFVVAEALDAALARALASRACEAADVVAAIHARGEDGVHVVIQRGEAVTRVDCGALLSRLATRLGGRGGGRPNRAEGRLAAGADVATALEELRRE